MSSRIRQIAEACITAYAQGSTVTPIAEGYLIDGTPQQRVFWGRRNLDTNQPAPRIVLVPQGGSIVPPDMVGGGLIDPQTRDNIVRVRVFNLYCFCWGENEEQTEQMEHNLIAAIERACGPSAISFDGEEWLDQQEGKTGWSQRGQSVMFIATFKIPIYKTPNPLTIVTAIDHTTDWGNPPTNEGC